MPQRIAATFALTTFAFCLLIGMRAGNSFSTILLRALLALAATFVIGLILGLVARKMLEENLRDEQQRLRNLQPELSPKTDK